MVAVMDCVNRYFQLTGQGVKTAYYIYCGMGEILLHMGTTRTVQLRDIFCQRTDSFVSGLGSFLIKQVDDLFIQATE